MAATYSTPHDHRLYGRGHAERVQATIDLINQHGPVGSVADLSCGNGAIVAGIQPSPTVKILGDYAPGWPITGPIEDTIFGLPHVDLFVCSETLEHLDDPDRVLWCIRETTAGLVVSTPIDCWADSNAEHLWAWSAEDAAAMLVDAGFTPRWQTMVDSREYGEPYCYGIWMCA